MHRWHVHHTNLILSPDTAGKNRQYSRTRILLQYVGLGLQIGHNNVGKAKIVAGLARHKVIKINALRIRCEIECRIQIAAECYRHKYCFFLRNNNKNTKNLIFSL